jgi:hypothetical protein
MSAAGSGEVPLPLEEDFFVKLSESAENVRNALLQNPIQVSVDGDKLRKEMTDALRCFRIAQANCAECLSKESEERVRPGDPSPLLQPDIAKRLSASINKRNKDESGTPKFPETPSTADYKGLSDELKKTAKEFFKVFDQYLGPFAQYEHIVTNDTHFSQRLAEFWANLGPLREQTRQLHRDFQDLLKNLSEGGDGGNVEGDGQGGQLFSPGATDHYKEQIAKWIINMVSPPSEASSTGSA